MNRPNEIFNVDGVAIRGFDVVAFFELNQAVKGKEQFSFSWKHVKWQFSTEEYLELFKSNPEKYCPQYGGYCAFGVSEGYKASTKPTAFTLSKGKLYLNFAHYVKKRWSEKKNEKTKLADKQWTEILSTEPIKAHPIPIWWKYQFLKRFGRDLFE